MKTRYQAAKNEMNHSQNSNSSEGTLNFDLLYRQFSPKVYMKCLSLLKDEALAKDAMQEIFIRAFLKSDQFRQEAKVSTWLYSITFNYCMDYLKKQQAKRVKMGEDLQEALTIADEVTDPQLIDGKIAELRIVLAELPTSDRKILLMKFQEDMSIKEMAQRKNKSEGAIKMKLNRAKAKARQLRTQHATRLTA
jgi:RNA polymerase sigma-70 factor (ECF subfamily)